MGDVAQLMAQDGKHCPVHLLQVSRPLEEELSLLQQSPGHPQLGHLAWGEAGAGVDRPLLGLRYQQGRDLHRPAEVLQRLLIPLQAAPLDGHARLCCCAPPLFLPPGLF